MVCCCGPSAWPSRGHAGFLSSGQQCQALPLAYCSAGALAVALPPCHLASCLVPCGRSAGAAKDLGADGVFDLHSTKWWALKLATEAAVTVLRIDQIIMAKMAGGPKPRAGGMDDED